jgi:hypothetical protein
MNYPPDFPSRSRARVEAEKIRAETDFYASIGSTSLLSEINGLRECISRGFLTFAREACTLGWSVDKIDAKCCDFLCLLAIGAHQRGYDLLGGSLFLSLTWEQLLPRVKREFQGTAQWQQYNELLLKVAEAQSAVVPESAEPSAAQPASVAGLKASEDRHHAIGEQQPRTSDPKGTPAMAVRSDYQGKKVRPESHFTRSAKSALIRAPHASGLQISLSIDEDGVQPTKNMKGRSYEECLQS